MLCGWEVAFFHGEDVKKIVCWESVNGSLYLPYKPTLGEGQIPRMLFGLWPAPGSLVGRKSAKMMWLNKKYCVRTSESDQNYMKEVDLCALK